MSVASSTIDKGAIRLVMRQPSASWPAYICRQSFSTYLYIFYTTHTYFIFINMLYYIYLHILNCEVGMYSFCKDLSSACCKKKRSLRTNQSCMIKDRFMGGGKV